MTKLKIVDCGNNKETFIEIGSQQIDLKNVSSYELKRKSTEKIELLITYEFDLKDIKIECNKQE